MADRPQWAVEVAVEVVCGSPRAVCGGWFQMADRPQWAVEVEVDVEMEVEAEALELCVVAGSRWLTACSERYRWRLEVEIEVEVEVEIDEER